MSVTCTGEVWIAIKIWRHGFYFTELASVIARYLDMSTFFCKKPNFDFVKLSSLGYIVGYLHDIFR